MIPQTPAAGATVTSAILSDGDEAAQIEETGWGWRYNRWGWRRRWGRGWGRGRRCWRGRWGRWYCRW